MYGDVGESDESEETKTEASAKSTPKSVKSQKSKASRVMGEVAAADDDDGAVAGPSGLSAIPTPPRRRTAPAPPKEAPIGSAASPAAATPKPAERLRAQNPQIRIQTASPVAPTEPKDQKPANPETAPIATRQQRPPNDEHLTMRCHLFPRLSETNLQFHDVYWSRAADGSPYIRKRMVRFCRLIRFHSIRLDRRALTAAEAETLNTDRFNVRLYLVDTAVGASRQIVSNIHEALIPIAEGRSFLCASPSVSSTALVRSNYKQSAVVLRIELHRNRGDLIADFEMPLLDAAGEIRPLPRGLQWMGVGAMRFAFSVVEIPSRMVADADSLPDILICAERWIPMIAAYRRLTAKYLAIRPHSVWITDPVVATFPRMCDDPRLAEILVSVLEKKAKFDVLTFRETYMNYIYPIIFTIPLRSDRTAEELRAFVEKADGNPLRVLVSEQSSIPLNIKDYVAHLSGVHAID